MSFRWNILFGVLLWLLVQAHAHAALAAWLDRDRASLGEVVTLNVQSDEANAAPPDFSALSENFDLRGTSSSSQISISNGERRAVTLWAVVLQPKREGVLAIPALQSGSSSSEPLSLTVAPAATQASSNVGDDVRLEVEVDTRTPYVQQTTRYVVRLKYAIPLEGQLDQPQVDGASVQRVGEDVKSQQMIDGRRFQVLERIYAITPERSGALEVSAPRLAGSTYGDALGQMFGGGRSVHANGDVVRLDVRPRPQGASDPWLPARSLHLSANLDQDREYRVGTAIGLELKVVAEGLAAEQLPELQVGEIAGAQVYPDQAAPQTAQREGWLHSSVSRRFAIVPQQAGRLTIPAQELRWWNTQTDRLDVARVPAQTIDVLPALGVTPAPVLVPPTPVSQPAATPASPAPASTYWPDWAWPVACGGLVLLWLCTLAWGLRRRADRAPNTTIRQEAAPRRDATGLREALRRGSLTDIALALRSAAPTGTGIALGAIAEQLDDHGQRDAVLALERCLYGNQADATACLSLLRAAFGRSPRWRGDSTVIDATDVLPPLYPG